MLLKKTDWFWKSGFIAINTILLLNISGCSDVTQMETQTMESKSEVQSFEQNTPEEAEKLIEICYDLYEKAAVENKLDDLEVIRSIVNRFGENGYAAIDSQNQIDMTEMEQVIRFCEKVDSKEEDKLTIIKVSYSGGFAEYDLQTKDGNVDVTRSYYGYDNGKLQYTAAGSYTASRWQYTEDGYLIFSGAWFSEERYALTLSSAEEHAAFRVQPLDEKCRELNRKYLIPIGYGKNNLFLVDWSEEDFGELNFYDLYDIFYPKVNAQPVPYTADDNLGVGAVYQIPEAEFELVIMKYFNIGSETLRSKTTYCPKEMAYEYKPRGFFEAEYPERPYSEVVSYTENSNGTIALTVNVVFPYKGISKVYTHEAVIRPLDDGGVQYVSNRIMPSENDYEVTWYKPRLTEEQWEEVYGGL